MRSEKAQRGQYLLAVDLGRYITRNCEIPHRLERRTKHSLNGVETPKVKAQRGQDLLAVDLGRYISRNCEIPHRLERGTKHSL